MRLIDRLAALELPAGQVHSSGPCYRYCAPKPINSDRLIANRAVAQRRAQTTFGSLAFAGRADPPRRAALNLGCVDPKQAKSFGTTAKCVAVYDIRTWAINHLRNPQKVHRLRRHYRHLATSDNPAHLV